MDNFINDIIKGLNGLNGNTAPGNKNWTMAIKKSLVDVANKNNLNIYCKLDEKYGKNHENSEWLYDAIMYSYNLEDGVFDEVYLVAESEWDMSYEAIEYDFLKLIFTRAKVRLIVYQVSKENYDEYKESLINIIQKSKSCEKGDIYLFAIYNTSDDGFDVEKIIKE